MAFRVAALRAVSIFTRRVRPKGIDRVLRLLHSPHRRRWSIDTMVTTTDGIRFHINTASYLEWCVFFYGAYEKETQNFVRSHVRPGSEVIDVGANIGTQTLVMAQAVRGGRVIACEPNPPVYDRLLQNLALNSVSNVTPCQVALAERIGKASLYVPTTTDANQGVARIGPATDQTQMSSPLRTDAASLTVDAETLDHLAIRLGLCDVSLIKIDVEGFESAVLQGAQQVLKNSRPVLVFEYEARLWTAAGYRIADVISNLRRLGYDRFGHIAGDGFRPVVIRSPESIPHFANIVATRQLSPCASGKSGGGYPLIW